MSHEVLGEGKPELFWVVFTGVDGMQRGYVCHSIKMAHEIRDYYDGLRGTDLDYRPKGPVRIARFRGEWL